MSPAAWHATKCDRAAGEPLQMMYTWAFYSLKGGVGKTAAAVNVAWEAAQAGRSVLLWDLDPQGAATWYLRAQDARSGPVKKVLAGKTPLGRLIRKTDYPRLQVIPADISYRHVDSVLDQTNKHKKLLRRLLAPLSEDYQLIVLDCPPSMSRLAAAVVHACDLLIVPALPTPLSLWALTHVREFAAKQGLAADSIRPLASLVDRRKRMHSDIIDGSAPELADRLSTFISYNSNVERMGLHQAPVGTFAPHSVGAQQFAVLWHELNKRYGKDW